MGVLVAESEHSCPEDHILARLQGLMDEYIAHGRTIEVSDLEGMGRFELTIPGLFACMKH